METKKLTCSCGQVTQLEKDGDLWRYAQNPHGSNAVQTGCFNCNAPLGLPGEASAAPAAVAPATAETEFVVVSAQNLKSFKRDQLLAIADAYDVNLSDAENNAQRQEVLSEELFPDAAPPETKHVIVTPENIQAMDQSELAALAEDVNVDLSGLKLADAKEFLIVELFSANDGADAEK